MGKKNKYKPQPSTQAQGQAQTQVQARAQAQAQAPAQPKSGAAATSQSGDEMEKSKEVLQQAQGTPSGPPQMQKSEGDGAQSTQKKQNNEKQEKQNSGISKQQQQQWGQTPPPQQQQQQQQRAEVVKSYANQQSTGGARGSQQQPRQQQAWANLLRSSSNQQGTSPATSTSNATPKQGSAVSQQQQQPLQSPVNQQSTKETISKVSISTPQQDKRGSQQQQQPQQQQAWANLLRLPFNQQGTSPATPTSNFTPKKDPEGPQQQQQQQQQQQPWGKPLQSTGNLQSTVGVADSYKSPISSTAYTSPISSINYQSPVSSTTYKTPVPSSTFKSPLPSTTYKTPLSSTSLSPLSSNSYKSPLSSNSYKSPLSSTAYKTPSSPAAYMSPAGPRGQKIEIVDTNYFPLNLSKMPEVAFHYDVTITPDHPKKFIRKAFQQFNAQFFQGVAMAFDGRKNVYTVRKLENTPFEATFEFRLDEMRPIEYKVVIKETDSLEIDLSVLKTYCIDRNSEKPMRALQCLEVVLANPCHSRGVRVGRSFFTKPNTYCDLGDGFEMWIGMYQAAILGERPFLNVDICHMPFPSPWRLPELLRKTLNCDIRKPLSDSMLHALRQRLIGTIIIYSPPKQFLVRHRTYKVNDVSQKSANDLYFDAADGNKWTVTQYFAYKGHKLQYPHLNCLHVGSREKNNYLPLELCDVAEGQVIKKWGSNQVSAMIAKAASNTDYRKHKIMNIVKNFEHNKDDLISNFGISVDPKFIEVPIRVLQAPRLEYHRQALVKPFSGSWNLQDSHKFLLSSTRGDKNVTYNWMIALRVGSTISSGQVLEKARSLRSRARLLNIFFSEEPIIKYSDFDVALREARDKQCHLVLMVVSNSGGTYAAIKQAAELKYGVLTQCIKENTFASRFDSNVITNILLKINAKLNGTNHKICGESSVPLKNVMFVGADVTHPSPDQRLIPSVVGVAASFDPNGACYNMQYRLQQATREDIVDMDSIMSHHLKVYFERRKSYPEHIIYYRDGVSEGQFPIIKKIELSAIRATCNNLRISPKITCVVVIKRHHTRLFPRATTKQRCNNVDPGTVVDRIICHPNEVQFFLVSHSSPMGTARPTRYNIIQNDANLNMDMLQTMTYNLCHMFPRCNRTVSYPAPAYLAHLIAYRGRIYIEGEQRFNDLQEAYQRRLINANLLRNNPMFFV